MVVSRRIITNICIKLLSNFMFFAPIIIHAIFFQISYRNCSVHGKFLNIPDSHAFFPHYAIYSSVRFLIIFFCFCVFISFTSYFYCIFRRNVGGNIRDGITGLSGYVRLYFCFVFCIFKFEVPY